MNARLHVWRSHAPPHSCRCATVASDHPSSPHALAVRCGPLAQITWTSTPLPPTSLNMMPHCPINREDPTSPQSSRAGTQVVKSLQGYVTALPTAATVGILGLRVRATSTAEALSDVLYSQLCFRLIFDLSTSVVPCFGLTRLLLGDDVRETASANRVPRPPGFNSARRP